MLDSPHGAGGRPAREPKLSRKAKEARILRERLDGVVYALCVSWCAARDLSCSFLSLLWEERFAMAKVAFVLRRAMRQ